MESEHSELKNCIKYNKQNLKKQLFQKCADAEWGRKGLWWLELEDCICFLVNSKCFKTVTPETVNICFQIYALVFSVLD
jgi:hypothetical protein